MSFMNLRFPEWIMYYVGIVRVVMRIDPGEPVPPGAMPASLRHYSAT